MVRVTDYYHSGVHPEYYAISHQNPNISSWSAIKTTVACVCVCVCVWRWRWRVTAGLALGSWRCTPPTAAKATMRSANEALAGSHHLRAQLAFLFTHGTVWPRRAGPQGWGGGAGVSTVRTWAKLARGGGAGNAALRRKFSKIGKGRGVIVRSHLDGPEEVVLLHGVAHVGVDEEGVDLAVDVLDGDLEAVEAPRLGDL